MILLIDNYDSFSYNLYQLVGSIEPDIKVIRNDAMTVGDIEKMNPDGIIISPGPGRPEDSGICPEVIRKLGSRFPILGVCLGHQAICEVFGAEITRAVKLMHGKKSNINLDNSCKIFAGLPKVVDGARYHSLIAKKDTIPDELIVTAEDDMGEVMAVRHRDYEIYGLQFHPESILTSHGMDMIRNFINN